MGHSWFVDNPNEDRCHKKVSDHTGFHFRQCSRPGKFRLKHNDLEVFVCGTHKNELLNRAEWDEANKWILL